MTARADDRYSFALCLSHDVDRVYKTPQNHLFDSISERDPRELVGMFSGKNPYWQFERIAALESELGVRSSFNVLDEQRLGERPKAEWATVSGWSRYTGRYDVTDPQLVSTLRVLLDGGWEIGLQGSFCSPEDRTRLEYEKERIESAIGAELVGNRQHYLNLTEPDTWAHHRAIGLGYDTSLADPNELHFQRGYDLLRPFDDEFVVFPWTIMDQTVMESGDSTDDIRANCEAVLEEARAHGSVLVLDWHQRVFTDEEFPGWGDAYRWTIERAMEMGAWVGTPGEFYEAIPHPGGTVADALAALEALEAAQTDVELLGRAVR
ncbi:hypothetical protein ACFQGT_15630 [Natrialbaceae archaeon GCM10025810]|uniref:hypothetical protein n=1 Tax=Halovalidus salilacus TaxID=3075124 RepID=UPI0036156DE1